MTIEEEVCKRRTFAIISHPDAGKTTLTEKLLLYGGAIHVAGSGLRAQASARRRPATGWRWSASAASRSPRPCCSSPIAGYTLNLLDTPGPPGFRRGHVSHAARRRQRGHADRRRQRRRAADEKALRDLPRARHSAVHVREQDRSAEPRSARAARRAGKRARHRRVPDELAARQRRRRSAACTTAAAARVHLLRARRARRDARGRYR